MPRPKPRNPLWGKRKRLAHSLSLGYCFSRSRSRRACLVSDRIMQLGSRDSGFTGLYRSRLFALVSGLYIYQVDFRLLGVGIRGLGRVRSRWLFYDIYNDINTPYLNLFRVKDESTDFQLTISPASCDTGAR